MYPMGKRDKNGNSSKFIMLDHWIFDHPSYRSLSLGARGLHWELIRKYNGYNNGRLFLSHRSAEPRLGRSRNTVGLYYKELERAGFILKTRGHCLGPVGIGEANHWSLTHVSVNGCKATMEFKKIKSPPKNRAPHVP
jgi:hypothetical protein